MTHTILTAEAPPTAPAAEQMTHMDEVTIFIPDDPVLAAQHKQPAEQHPNVAPAHPPIQNPAATSIG